MTWTESLAANYTDGIVVLHRGCIVYERYFGALTAERPHVAFSVTKSFFGTIAATLIAEGTLDPPHTWRATSRNSPAAASATQRSRKCST